MLGEQTEEKKKVADLSVIEEYDRMCEDEMQGVNEHVDTNTSITEHKKVKPSSKLGGKRTVKD